MGKVISNCALVAMSALMVWFWFRGVYAMIKAVANRTPGCGVFEASNGRSLLFSNDNYTEEGLKWVRTYRRCLAGFILVPVVFGLLLGLLTLFVAPFKSSP